MYNLDELAAFSAVFGSGSLTNSARELGVAKSTLSRRLSQLESQLGQPLLRRQANRLIPTEAGILFHRYCEQILSLASQSQHALDELREEVSGELVIHMHEAFARGWFVRELETFLARYPALRLTLHTQLTPPRGPEDTALCLWLGMLPECGLRQETLGAMTRGLYAHPDYLAKRGEPRHPRELSEHAWVDLLGESSQGLWLRHMGDEDECQILPSPSWLRVDQHVLHIDAIARGKGLGLLPHWMAEQRLSHHPESLKACLPQWQAPPLPVTLLYPFGRQPRKLTALIKHLRQATPEEWQGTTSPSLSRPAPALA